jgi:hypothetical protein
MILNSPTIRKPSSSTSSSSRARSSSGGRGIDKSGELPRRRDARGAGQGLLGVTIPKAWGGLGKDYIATRWRSRRLRASATVAVSLSVTNSLVAEVIAHAGRDQRDRRLQAGAVKPSAPSRCRSRTPAPMRRTSRRRPCGRGDGYRSPASRCGSRTPRTLQAIAARTRPGLRDRASPHSSWRWIQRHQANGPRRFARRPRSRCMDPELDLTVADDQVLGRVDQL